MGRRLWRACLVVCAMLLVTDPAIASGRTDGYGVAVLPFPGPGTYELRAHTDLRCCLRDGTLETTLERAGELVVVETITGPCPTWTPESCN